MGSIDVWVEYWYRGPARPALAVGETLLNWQTLWRRSGRLGADLTTAGVHRADHVGVFSRDPVTVVQAIIACARIGAVAVPLDPQRPPEELAALAAGADLSALVGDDLIGSAVPADRVFTGVGEAADIQSDLERIEVGMDEPALLLHTRGVTGPPKAAVLTHGNVESVAVAGIGADGLVPTDRVAVTLPSIATPAGLATTLAALHSGAMLWCTGDADLAELLSGGGAFQPTVVVTTVDQLEQALGGRLPNVRGPRTVKVIGPVPEHVRKACVAADIPLVEAYGLAEGGGLNLQQPTDSPGGLVPVLGQHAQVVDANGTPLPAGQPGELVLAGTAVMRGYRIGGTIHELGDGWLHTGDVAVADEAGLLTILGRHDSASGKR